MSKGFSRTAVRKGHPYLPELCEALRRERIDRREFLRTATLLGVSAPAAYLAAAQILGDGLLPSAQAAEAPKTGGRLRCSMRVQRMDDPATYDWTQMSNQTRHILEYLTITGPDNITRPYLAEGWEASDDLKTWTFKLREGIQWSNGDEFNADDVVYNFERWLDPATGSSNLGLFAQMTEEVETGKTDAQGNPITERRMVGGAVEKLGPYMVRLNLTAPVLSIPENLYNYPTAIVHRRFGEEGGNFAANPVGTGPFALAEFAIGERCVLRRRPEPYWGGEVFLDEIVYIDHGDEPAAGIAALASDQVDMIFEVANEVTDQVERLPDAVLHQAVTAQTAVARMRVTEKPFIDRRVRQAIAGCMDHKAILDLAYRGRGAAGENHHVAPIHPEYFELPPLVQDHEKAKALLTESGHARGMKLNIDLDGSYPWHAAAMQAFKEQLAPSGIDLDLNILPGARYWEVWDKTPFGFTAWTHRPLGVMVLNLGYRSGVPWNESDYANPEFDAALDVAGGILDADERRRAMEKVQSILQNDAVIAQPLWRAVFSATTKRVRGYEMHPTLYHQFNKIWLT